MKLRADILSYFDTEVRKSKSILASGYRREIEDGVRRIVGPIPSAAHNWIDYFELESSDLDQAIASQKNYFRSIRHSFRWKFYSHDQSQNLPDQLVKHGFHPWEPCALMILDLAQFEPSQPDGIEYRQLADPEHLPHELAPIYEQVWTEGGDDFLKALQAEMQDMGSHLEIYAAKRNEETVGCGLTRYSERKSFGGLFAGSTIPAERGKGIYWGMVSKRAESAADSGADYLYTEAGEMSRPILERLGFEEMASIRNYVMENNHH